jgi:hypothetical protein
MEIHYIDNLNENRITENDVSSENSSRTDDDDSGESSSKAEGKDDNFSQK